MPNWGRPTMNFRLDPWQKRGLEYLANKAGITASDLLREMVAKYLAENSIGPDVNQPIDGQISANDLGV